MKVKRHEDGVGRRYVFTVGSPGSECVRAGTIPLRNSPSVKALLAGGIQANQDES